jgi:M6 family metalloprotease-like protein
LVRLALPIALIPLVWSSAVSGQTLGAPANLRASTLTANRVDLSWDNRSAGEDGFTIERALDVNGTPGPFTEIATLPARAIGYADKGLAAPATYWFRLRAYRESESGPYSDEVRATPCIGGAWQNLDTNALTAAGLGLREPPVASVYGVERRNGNVVWPGCAVLGGPVRVPVLMVDWQDFDPRVDPSNENSANTTFPDYVPSTPAQLQAFLQSDVAPYYSDVSGGQATVSFDIVGWIRSGSPGGYLKPRSQYLYNLHDLNASYPDPTWQCRKDDIFLDALRDAVVQAHLDLGRYDLDGDGLLDGAVLVYEGKGGLCSGGNLSWVNPSHSTNPPAFQWRSARELVPPSDPHWPLFAAQPGWIHFYNNIPERSGDAANSFYYSATWVHELGHLFFGYPDYYYSRFNLGSWMLSGNHGAVPAHPAALEKWLFARWIEPTVISETGDYTVTANEIPDGGSYSGGPYLFQIPIDGDANHFLTIEGRWFDAAGNTGTRWAPADSRESGLMIVEVNLAQDWYSSSPPQLNRYAPERGSGTPAAALRAFRPGDRFFRCYAEACVTIEPTSAPGPVFSFSVRLRPNRALGTGTYTWFVSGVKTASDVSATTAAPFVKMTSLRNAEPWTIGSPPAITWTHAWRISHWSLVISH